jgi:hypothetical protein
MLLSSVNDLTVEASLAHKVEILASQGIRAKDKARMTNLKLAITIPFLIAGSALSQGPYSAWTSTSNAPEIKYRFHVIGLTASPTCVLEFRDDNQGRNYTTFDADIKYQWVKIETDTEKVITSATQNGVANVRQCADVIDVNVNKLERR